LRHNGSAKDEAGITFTYPLNVHGHVEVIKLPLRTAFNVFVFAKVDGENAVLAQAGTIRQSKTDQEREGKTSKVCALSKKFSSGLAAPNASSACTGRKTGLNVSGGVRQKRRTSMILPGPTNGVG
jgi:hypothetical protein